MDGGEVKREEGGKKGGKGRNGRKGKGKEGKGNDQENRNLELRVNSNYVRIYSAKWQVNRQKITPRQT